MLFMGFETSIDEDVNAEVPDSSNRRDGDFVGYQSHDKCLFAEGNVENVSFFASSTNGVTTSR